MRYAVPVLFFGCFFACLLFHIDPAVIYTNNGLDIHNFVAAAHAPSQHFVSPHFGRKFILELTPEYLHGVVAAPGGFAWLLVTLLIYACHYPVAGAIALTGLALFFSWIFSLYVQGVAGLKPFVSRFLPALVILTICAWYELSLAAFLLPVAGALALAAIYQRFRPASAATHALWLTALFWSAWYLLQWGCLLFLILAGIHEIFAARRRIAPTLMAAVVSIALLYLLEVRFVPLDQTIRWKDFMALSGLPIAVIGFFPVSAVAIAAWNRLRPAERSAKPGAIVQIALLLAVCAGATFWLYRDPVNRDTRTIARTVHEVMNGDWDAVLHEKTSALFAESPKKAAMLQELMVQAVDHALCRTGQLGSRLFAYPQPGFDSDQLLLLNSTNLNDYASWVMLLDLSMDLGMVNTAEKMAGEIMENVGPYPDILYRRVLIQIAKGNKEAAFVYLNKLACMPFYREEAKRLLNNFGNDAVLLAEPRIATMRANMDTVDYFLVSVNHEDIFKHLLQSNLRNRAVYDYLMSFYLLNSLLDGVAALAPGAPTFGYTEMPRYWQEALCVFIATHSQQTGSALSFPGLQRHLVERYYLFARECTQLAHDPDAAAKLEPSFGDTYYYYYVFGHSRGEQHE